jgi:HTH-type transcriptional regulator/antitoxin HigA
MPKKSVMLRPIRNKVQYEDALARVYELMQKNLMAESKESDELEVLSTFIKAYEREYFPIPKPSPIEAIKFRLEQMRKY